MAAPSNRELEDYWGETKTTPAALDNFFDEDSTISWTGSGGTGQLERHLSSTSIGPSPTTRPLVSFSIEEEHESSSSILDNITTDDHIVQHISNAPLSSSSSSSSLSRGVGRSLGSLGEKLQDWRPPSVRKWSSGQGATVDRCSNCTRLEREVAQLSSRLKASFSRHHVSLPAVSTVRAMLLGEPYTLHTYISLSDKQDLLHSALRTADTATIVAVLVFLKNTLSKQLFRQELERHPVAAQSFLCYLKQRRQLAEAGDLLLALGRKEEAALLKYRQCLQTNDHNQRVTNLTQLLSQHLAEPAMAHYNRLVKDQIDLLQRQKAIDEQDAVSTSSNSVLAEHPRASTLYDKPLLTTLYYCSMYHWGGNSGGSGDTGPNLLRLQYRLTDRQYLWGVVRGRARVRHYYLPDQLAALLQTRGGVLGALGGALGAVGASLSGGSSAGGALRSVLPLDRIVDALRQAGAPDAVLAAYLSLVEPKEQRLRLALHHGVRQAAVEAYIVLKDRAGLQSFLSQLVPGSADYIKAETALKTGRWK